LLPYEYSCLRRPPAPIRRLKCNRTDIRTSESEAITIPMALAAGAWLMRTRVVASVRTGSLVGALFGRHSRHGARLRPATAPEAPRASAVACRARRLARRHLLSDCADSADLGGLSTYFLGRREPPYSVYVPR